MRFGAIIEGLQILAKYEEKGLDAQLNGADHDLLWATGAEVVDDGEPDIRDVRISNDDHARLRELGWFIGSEYGDAWTAYV